MANIFFHDLPVYRLPEAPYSVWFNRQVSHLVARTFLGVAAPTPQCVKNTRKIIERQCCEKYGPWQFNEIVGYIRLHFLESQICGEFYSSARILTKRARVKVFTQRTDKLPPARDVPAGATNSQILEAIKQYVEDCRQELPRQFLDDEWLDRMGPMVDWNSVLQASSRQEARKRIAAE
jgi:hypothetical protein